MSNKRATLKISFDLAANGYSEDGFREDPASAMRVMLDRGYALLKGQSLTMLGDTVYTVMGWPVGTLVREKEQ